MSRLFYLGMGIVYGWAFAVLLYRERVRRLIEQASEQMTRADHAEAELARAQIQPVRDYPRPLGAPHVTPPVGSQWQCRCGQCVTKRTMRQRRHFGISRIDSGATHCWFVRLRYSPASPKIVRSFSDGVYGGKRRAESAALSFRDRKLGRVGASALGEDA